MLLAETMVKHGALDLSVGEMQEIVLDAVKAPGVDTVWRWVVPAAVSSTSARPRIGRR